MQCNPFTSPPRGANIPLLLGKRHLLFSSIHLLTASQIYPRKL